MKVLHIDYCDHIFSNSHVLQEVEPSLQSVNDWLDSCKNNLSKKGDSKNLLFENAVHFLYKISNAANKESFVRLENRKGTPLSFSIGQKKNQNNIKRKSEIVVDNGRVFVKVRKNLIIRFVMDKRYIEDFDVRMMVDNFDDMKKNTANNGHSYKARFKEERHKKKPDLRVREVCFKLNSYLYEHLEYFFSTFQLTDFYKNCSILKNWMPDVFSGASYRNNLGSLNDKQESIDDEYQKIIQDSTAIVLSKGPIKRPQKVKQGNNYLWLRNHGIAKDAIEKAKFKCLVNDEHMSFTSNKTGKQYVEAHHIFPMSSQEKFLHSLDVPENIASLCPNCHKKIHLATSSEKKHMLKYLFDLRKNDLKERDIDWTFEELYKLYY